MVTRNSSGFYKKIGTKGLRAIAAEYTANDAIPFVKKRAKKEENILDMACGYGRVSIPLAQAGYRSVTGIDLAPNLIRSARKNAKSKKLHIQFDVGNMTALPYSSNSFDKIFCLWNSFNEVFNPKDQLKTLKEVYRVLRPGGKAFFSIFDGESAEIRKMFKTGELNPNNPLIKKRFKNVDVYQYIYTKAALQRLVRHSPFKKSSITFITSHQRRRILLTLSK